jgi:hypothetical protein
MSENRSLLAGVSIALVPPLLLGLNALGILASAYGYFGPSSPEAFLFFAILWLVGVIAATCFIWNTPRLQFAVSLAWLLLFLVAGFVMNIWTVWQITAVI